MSINRVNISGNLTRDSELRQTGSGMSVLQFGVAVNDRVKQGDQWVDHPNFIDCTMFGTRAEKIAQYLKKGCKVAVEGKLRYSSWEKDGQKRSKLEVIVDELEFMSSQQGGQQAPQYQPAPQYAPQPQYQQYQPQYAPQSAPQQGYAPQYQQQQMAYPNQVASQAYQTAQQMPGAPAQGVYDEDIPFS